MTVSARTANNVTAPARAGDRNMRSGPAVPAGTYAFEVGSEVVTGWHRHDLHQLEYAFEGVAQVETATARYLLPPQQAAWIPAGVEHCTTLTRTRSLAVFFDPGFFASRFPGASAGPRARPGPAGNQVRILAVAPVLREMALYGRRWPIGRQSSDPAADAFFAGLVHVIADFLDREVPLFLPASSDPLVAAAMGHTLANLADVTLPAVCAAVSASERTLRRAFGAQAGMSWRDYLLQARLLRAMALLSEPGPTVLAIATEVGFASMSGFARAFRRFTGETPLGYRQRVMSSARR